ncbi:MAG: aspartate aminotransferase family protein [Candidatus Dormibacteraeota bacterium]|nr:aspartate aminotransferase family protein [Candidatus Dormibacteraeota bacterium]
MSAAVWREREAELLSPAYHRYTDLVVDHAEGTHLYTVDGRDVLDFGCGIGVTNLGHLNPEVTRAVHAQVDKLWHTSVTTYNPKMIEAAEVLVSVMPEGLNRVFFNNSGAEAVEGAIKLARAATGRTDLIAFAGAFHGRTYGALSLTASKARYRAAAGPLLAGVHHARYPYCYRYCSHGPGERCSIAEGDELRLMLATSAPPQNVAAIVVEPVLGEGGYVVPPPSFLPMLRNLCDEHGMLLIADEVQSGFGRTGRTFAFEHFGVTPDIVTLAKGLGNGMPIGATVARDEVMRAWSPGDHGTTYGGNAVACAAAIAVIETLSRDGLCARAARLGAAVMDRMRALQRDVAELGDVRVLGLMIGLEFTRDGRPAADLVARITADALHRGVLLLTCGTDDNVIRLIPPLTVTEDELAAGVDALEASIRAQTQR